MLTAGSTQRQPQLGSAAGTTVITGGLGGLGSLAAVVLAGQCSMPAGRLLLLGRSGRAPLSSTALQVMPIYVHDCEPVAPISECK